MRNLLNGLKVSICQMSVVPGRPDINSAYIISEIEAAKSRRIDIIAFPEMATTGYLIGDKFEDSYFIEDVLLWNKRIVASTDSITAIFGTVTVSKGMGEDGRQRKHNSAVVARDGKAWHTVKSLQPNYRFFNDDKHFLSGRKIAEERQELFRNSAVGKSPANIGRSVSTLNEYLAPMYADTSIGRLKIGVILCEDMWHEDYPFNPAKILVDKGANIIFNLSASPWTWQKNRKRHQVVKELLTECPVPFVYVNNTGTQNSGKNIMVFDGSSTIYDGSGEIIFEIPPYENGSRDFVFDTAAKPITPKEQRDTEELYNAMVCSTKSMVRDDIKVLVGLSGGIDSSTVAAHMVDVLGPQRVIGINMPMGRLNSPKTRHLAQKVAENLGIEYNVFPITDTVKSICEQTLVKEGTLAYENVQARARMEILAAYAQKIGAYYTCNSNKDEVAFGYGTQYGDIAGFFAPLGDMVKREVRQIADYMNRERFKREVIPNECITQVPTAELAKNQKDPFDYGDLNRRGYHDEMVRAYTEFRKNPEWMLEMYIKGRLEKELKLEPGTLKRLFPEDADFIKDLKHWWTVFQRSFFKRVQCPPIPIFSKRAFGRDMEESLMQAHFTEKFSYLETLLAQKFNPETEKTSNSLAVFGTSSNPPGLHHKNIAEHLAKEFDVVIVVPSGTREQKESLLHVPQRHRKAMASINFEGMHNVRVDYHDLDNDTFTPTWMLQERYAKAFPNSQIWFAVGGDLVAGGREEKSEIQREWIRGEEVWQNLNFALINHPGRKIHPADTPPNYRMVNIPAFQGRSTHIRELLARGESITGFVHPRVEAYIKENKLYIS